MTDRNENRPGYKKTKVGWIPDEWEVLPAGEVFDIQLGKMLSEKARQGNNPQPYLANLMYSGEVLIFLKFKKWIFQKEKWQNSN